MSKGETVIVFSTRFISPLNQESLFSGDNPEPFTSKLLADYFWDEIKVDDNLLTEMLANKNYFKEEYLKTLNIDKKKKELIKCINTTYSNELESTLTEINSSLPSNNIVSSTDNFDWIFSLLIEIPKEMRKGWMEKLLNLYYDYDTNPIDIEELRNQKSTSVSKNLQNDPSLIQRSFNIDNRGTRKVGPWMAYRFSYYKSKLSTDKISLYTVWSLDQSCKIDSSGSYQWVEALTDQFVTHLHPKARTFYLLLHDNDIERSLFKVLIEDTINNTKRYVALFQHVDPVGDFLKKPNDRSTSGILRFKNLISSMVNDTQKLKLLCEVSDCIATDNFNIDLLSPYEDLTEIKTIIENIKNLPDSEIKAVVDPKLNLKLLLINKLNQAFNQLMIVNSKT